ncbi:hypothetical protein F8M49_09070 [Rhodococcus zopfii]|uniref:Uncharacterized protein n=1 Tax=Rhodococcus zopfii TaxID=43772 RepID=A0ABU3WNF9_9NOCA|nr:hypothetical protein [Rhodococcus zopfii]
MLTIGDGRVGLLFSGGAGRVTLGVSLAAGVAWGARVRSYRAFAAVVGLALVAFSVAPSGGELAVYAAASGAGMLLGSLAATVPPLGVVHGQTALAAGAIAGILCAESLVRLRRESSPRRYADYLPSSAEPVDALPLVFVVAAALAVLVLMLQADTGTAAPEDVRLRGEGTARRDHPSRGLADPALAIRRVGDRPVRGYGVTRLVVGRPRSDPGHGRHGGVDSRSGGCGAAGRDRGCVRRSE